MFNINEIICTIHDIWDDTDSLDPSDKYKIGKCLEEIQEVFIENSNEEIIHDLFDMNSEE